MTWLPTCARKKRFPSYASAKELRDLLRARNPQDATLHVYPCGDHFHVGHARGAKAERIRRRAIKSSALPLHRTEANYGVRCSTCDGGGCPDCTDPA